MGELVFLPWRLEFGTMLMHWVRHVRRVVAENGHPPTVVYCRKGHECLFPNATKFVYDWEDTADVDRKWSTARKGAHKAVLDRIAEDAQTRWPDAKIIYPQRHYPKDQSDWNFYPIGASCMPGYDVVIAPRYRQHGEHRNYEHWQEVCDRLSEQNILFCLIGQKETSVDVVGVPEKQKAWFYPDDLQFTVGLMMASKLCLVTDSGMAHLAALCRRETLVIYDEPNVEAGKPEWPWALPHMQTHNPGKVSPILHGWDDPSRVVQQVLEAL